MPVRRFLLASVVVVLSACDTRLPLAPSAPAGEPGATPPSTVLSADLQGIVVSTNAERAKAGLGVLTVNAQLVKAAQLTSDQLVSSGIFAHTIPGGQYPEFTDRIKAGGYLGWITVGENIAKGPPLVTGDVIFAAWMASPPHKENILDPRYAEIGVAMTVAGDGTRFYVQEFGHR